MICETDVIIPVAALTVGTFHCCSTTIRTCAAFTDARIRVMGNNTKEPWRSELKSLSESLGCEWSYLSGMDGSLNLSKIMNDAMKESKAKYICQCQADLIFYPDWLEHLIWLWESQPDYFMLSPYSHSPSNDRWKNLPKEPVNKILWEHPHASTSGVIVFKVSDRYLFDERFAAWENDSDLYWYVKSKGLRTGICLNSRVDHLGQAFWSQPESKQSFGPDFLQQRKLSDLLKQKWNLP